MNLTFYSVNEAVVGTKQKKVQLEITIKKQNNQIILVTKKMMVRVKKKKKKSHLQSVSYFMCWEPL